MNCYPEVVSHVTRGQYGAENMDRKNVKVWAEEQEFSLLSLSRLLLSQEFTD